uniref:Ig-like domain-containing protein n=1 Tax=Gopherus evgoodei TaxID=1825980 RepID=A0A8C4YBH7_9SAUR
ILLPQFNVIGPGHPVTAIVGEAIVLPCHLSPRMSAVNMKVRWFQSEFPSFVHLYQHGKDQYENQRPEYHRRTELLKAGITDGNVSLQILNIRRSDEGQYHCFVQDGPFYEEALLELKVAALGSNTLISVESHQDGGIRVVCQSAGWYPEPKVLWRDPSGQELLSLSEAKSLGDSGLFETENSIIIKERSNQNLSCWVRNTVLNQEMESTVYIAGQLPTKPTHPNPLSLTTKGNNPFSLPPSSRICPTTLRDLTLNPMCWAVRNSPWGDIAGRWRGRMGNAGLWGWPESLLGGRDGSAVALRGDLGCGEVGGISSRLSPPLKPLHHEQAA